MKLFKKSLIVIRGSIVFTVFLLYACDGPKACEINGNALATPSPPKPIGEKYVIDTKESVVMWRAFMQFVLGAGHHGYVYLSKGELMIDKDQLVGGSVVVDMNTIEDEKHGKDNNLINHLKNSDFFDVEKFPISTFGITAVNQVNADTLRVSGLLTIKGIMRIVTFPAKMEMKDGVVNATGKLTIDRTLWDVRYKSGKFFDNLKDDAISDNVEFDVKIVAKRVL